MKNYCKLEESNIWAKAALLVFVISMAALSLNKVHDYDTWIHLSMARAIIEEGGVPATDPYVCTREGDELYYPAWLFAIILYGANALSEINGMIMLKVLLIMTAFVVLMFDSKSPGHQGRSGVLSATIVLMAALVGRERFVERPDLVFILALVLSISILNKYKEGGNWRLLLILPPVHWVWANAHASIPFMHVPFLAFLSMGILRRISNNAGINRNWLKHEPDVGRLLPVALAYMCSFLLSALNPYGLKQYALGKDVIASGYLRSMIEELKPPTWDSAPLLYVFTAALVLTLLIGYRRVPIYRILVLVPGAILSYTYSRFIFLLPILGAPVMAIILTSLAQERFGGKNASLKLWRLFGVTVMLLMTWVALLGMGPFKASLQRPGLGLSTRSIPEGCLRYMDAKGIEGRIHTTYQWGQYIAWRDYPRRSPSIDGRCYLPEKMVDIFKESVESRYNPARMDDYSGKYGIEVSVLDYPLKELMNSSFNDYSSNLSLSHTGWSMVYWDDTCQVYLKRDGKYAALAKEDAYSTVNPTQNISNASPRLGDRTFSERLISELKRSINETGSGLSALSLGYVYNELGHYDMALDVMRPALNTGSEALGIKEGRLSSMGLALARKGRMSEAIYYFRAAFEAGQSAVNAYNLAKALSKHGRHGESKKYLKKAIKLDKSFALSYLLMAELLEQEGNEKEAMKYRDVYGQLSNY